MREMATEISFFCGKIILVNKKTAPLIMFYLSRENGKGACFNPMSEDKLIATIIVPGHWTVTKIAGQTETKQNYFWSASLFTFSTISHHEIRSKPRTSFDRL